MQELGYLRAVVDAKANQGEYAYSRCQLRLVGQRYAALGPEQLVELIDKSREKPDECGIEYLEKLLTLPVAEVMVFHKVVKVGIAFRLEHGEHVATHGVHAVDVRRTLAQEQSDILFFHPVALVEPCHSLVEMIACRHKPVVERVEVVERMFHLGVEVGQLCVLLT